MKLFDVKNGNLREFSKVNFDEEYTEKILENWLEDSPDMILEDGRLLIIGRQVQTNFNSIIDLLGIDKEGNMVVIELKRNKTPRDTLAQALEYTSFVENLGIEQIEKIFQKYLSDETSSLPDYHRNYFKLGPEDAVSFNTNQRILIIGQDISREVRETSIFLRKKGIRITCLEFSYFKTNTDTDSHLMSFDIVVGDESSNIEEVTSVSLPKITKEKFINALDTVGKKIFARLFTMADEKSLLVKWGTKGFSLNVKKNNDQIPICQGYPPQSFYQQAIRITSEGKYGFLNKVSISESVMKPLFSEAQNSGLFQLAGEMD
ncbi:endonuclease NucS [Desulfosarcina sp. OttesenSCG-928-G10]|nr:endonuclease NucS [Desulfosarcina sp. OttesenSCG-928-G10]